MLRRQQLHTDWSCCCGCGVAAAAAAGGGVAGGGGSGGSPYLERVDEKSVQGAEMASGAHEWTRAGSVRTLLPLWFLGNCCSSASLRACPTYRRHFLLKVDQAEREKKNRAWKSEAVWFMKHKSSLTHSNISARPSSLFIDKIYLYLTAIFFFSNPS